jgi:hypothetical protein
VSGIRREAVAALTSDVILVDRAIFDSLGYLEAALQVTGRPRDKERHPILENLARSYAWGLAAIPTSNSGEQPVKGY